MTAPAFLLVAVILGWPMLQAFYYGMTQWDGITSTWIGPSAYTHEFHDPAFRRVLQNNALLLLSIPLALAIPLGIAFLLDSHVFGWRVFRSAYFLPTAISWVVIGMVSERFFAAQGQLNSLLSAVGLGFLSTNFLAGQRTALLAVALTFVWSMIGTNMIIFLTGMATLDPNLAEAARVDGASGWQTFWRVTVPQLKRFIQFALDDDADQCLHGAVQPDLRDDERRARLRHDHTGVLRVPVRVLDYGDFGTGALLRVSSCS